MDTHVPGLTDLVAGHPEPDTGFELAFPAGFVWGAATAAYQIEGAAALDGRAPSIWDTFSHTPGRVEGGDTGDVACDHYHRYPEDVALLKELGLGAYRFSVSWSRVQPDGRGKVNEAGLDFYSRLTDELLRNGIRPMITLYHWDLPQALEDAGGWPERDTAERFADYAAIVHSRLGDRIADWTTLNEPTCAGYHGYFQGEKAPGRREPVAALAATHHLLLGHGLALTAMRAHARPGHRFAISLDPAPVYTDGDSPLDRDAVRRVDGMRNRIFLDPLFGRGYPADVVGDLRHITDWSFVHPGDEAIIGVPFDQLGVNFYQPIRVEPAPLEETHPTEYPGLRGIRCLPARGPLTGFGWEQHPESLYRLLVRIARDYPGVPMMITENGAAFDDVVGPDGVVHDTDRIAFFDAHLRAAHRALADGVDLRGYLAWSLLDNFEWAAGYSKRFGLVRVDFDTLQRTVKDSGAWYAGVARRNALGPLPVAG